jgi:thiamine biosynthesis lipoprotein
MNRLKNFISRVLLAIVLSGAALYALKYFYGPYSPYRRGISTKYYSVMGGVVLEVKLYGGREETSELSEKLYRSVEEVDKACDIYNPESELSRLNASAYKKPFRCSPLLWDILIFSKKYYEISGGAFDISSAPLMRLWGFYRKRQALPSDKEIKDVLQRVGLDKIEFRAADKSVRFKVPGMMLDVGGIAKGYAVERAAEKYSPSCGLINLSGNAHCFSDPFPGRDGYIIGIRNPLDKTGICGTVRMLGNSVATSGNYERYVIINGHHYAHIMDPRSGKPVEDMLSVTVVTPSAGDADALSTSVFINGPDFAEDYHRKNPDTSFLIIRRGKEGKPEMIKIGDIWQDCRL